jgi:hypothetical protein
MAQPEPWLSPTPLTTWNEVLQPAVEASLQHGQGIYGDLWREQHLDANPQKNAEHMVMFHIYPKLLAGVQRLDYGDYPGALKEWASAVGYLAVLIAKIRWCHLMKGGNTPFETPEV